MSDIKHKYPPVYGTNPIDALKLALELAKIYLQAFADKGCVILDGESRKPWKLEKGKTLSEQINEIKNNKDIFQKDKDKILGILKDTFGKLPHMKDQIYKAIDEN